MLANKWDPEVSLEAVGGRRSAWLKVSNQTCQGSANYQLCELGKVLALSASL